MTSEDADDERTNDADWSSLHGGVQPSPFVRGWLRMMRTLASGPVVLIPPDVLSVVGILALAAAWGAVAGLGRPALVAPLALAAGILDCLDGAVAVRTGRPARSGR